MECAPAQSRVAAAARRRASRPARPATAWLLVLEATYQVMVLRPYFANVGKRLVKTPKLFFTDTGTLCALVGLKSTEHAAAGPMGGAIFETAVIMEVFKTLVHRGQEPQLYFWRTASGQEVDLVVDIGAQLVPIEIKLTATPHPGMAEGIVAFREALARGPSGRIHLRAEAQRRIDDARRTRTSQWGGRASTRVAFWRSWRNRPGKCGRCANG